MPNPKKYDNQSDWMAACVPTRKREGDKQEQAVAVCLSMWRNKEADVEKSKWEHVKEMFAPKKKEESPHPFMVWKEEGEYRWLAVYSNKWRDEDNPPEILASTAHQEFEEAVDKGDWPYPEAWLWHVPGTRFGVADFVTYDDIGFALASGLVDKGMEHVAEALMLDDDLATSHGMPVKEIERDKDDPTIITRYRTIEISPLPREAAANKYGTGYEILQEVKMAVPDKKRPFLEDKLGAKGLDDLGARLADKAQELDELEIQSKDADEETVEQEEVVTEEEPVEESAEESAEEESKEADEETPNYVTAEEVVEAVGAYLKPILDQLGKVSALEETVAEQAKELKELRKSAEEKVKETIANTPAASLFDHFASTIGSPETLIDGREKLAKMSPKEFKDESEGPTVVGLVNELMAQSWGQKQ
jgi:hypothetical protein